ncbi:unnamed protein product [Orchesella dallaii]|uniref:Secreted protein n=1 Tax=Orchesella dallaii TaxID=48710 RepID=A0ABP1RMY6_9HEXA
MKLLIVVSIITAFTFMAASAVVEEEAHDATITGNESVLNRLNCIQIFWHPAQKWVEKQAPEASHSIAGNQEELKREPTYQKEHSSMNVSALEESQAPGGVTVKQSDPERPKAKRSKQQRKYSMDGR